MGIDDKLCDSSEVITLLIVTPARECAHKLVQLLSYYDISRMVTFLLLRQSYNLTFRSEQTTPEEEEITVVSGFAYEPWM